MSSFDVWIIRFEPGPGSPAERLQSAFGIDAISARTLEQSLPKVVKHAIPAKAAAEMRLALEAIGAIVECRPARAMKRVAGSEGSEHAAIFHPPGEDLLPASRISAIDPFESPAEAGAPRISVDDIPQLVRRPQTAPAPEEPDVRRIGSTLLTTSRAQQRRRYTRQAVGSIVAGGAILAIGWFFGGSVLRGEANWIGIGFDGLGIYFIGAGAYDLVTTLRS
jgi:hypothetical protein